MDFSPISKPYIKQLFALCLFCFMQLQGQAIPHYTLDAKWDEATDSFEIIQKIKFQNTGQKPLDTLYLNDWAHAYSSTKSPLANRLAEEFNRSFYLSKKSKRGHTEIKKLRVSNGENQWKRLDPQLDIIVIPLESPIEPGEAVEMDLHYTVKLPNGKYTGYGKLKKGAYFIENFFLTLSDFQQQKWQRMSNLDLEDIPYAKSNFDITLQLPQRYTVVANINALETLPQKDQHRHRFQAQNQREIIFHFGENLAYKSFRTDTGILLSDFEHKNSNETEVSRSLSQLNAFINEQLKQPTPTKQLLSKKKYNKRPFMGLSLLPNSLRAYPNQFEFEIESLSVLLRSRINEYLNTANREDFWFTEGLHFYLIKKYIDQHYPDKKILGSLLTLPLIKNLAKLYHLSELGFADGFKQYVEFVQRRNLQQPGFLPKEELIKFNERMGQPSHNALLMGYLEQNLEFDVLAFSAKASASKWTGEKLKNEFIAAQKTGYQKQISSLLQKRTSMDLKLKKQSFSKDSIRFSVKEKSGYTLPFDVALLQKDSIVSRKTYFPTNKKSILQFSKSEADYLQVYYPEIPDFNPRNNVRKLKGFSKPFKFTFVKDIEDPKKNQIFFNPRLNFNIYDGLSFGVRLNNKTIKSRPLTVVAQPIYSSLERTLIGSFSASYLKYKENSRNHITQLGLVANSFHYDQGLRYTLFLPYLNFYLRNNDLRNNKRELITLAGYHVNREQNSNALNHPNYNVVSLSYLFSKNEAIDYFTFKGGLQASDQFGKMETTTEFRKLLRSGRQFSFRAYTGKFLWHNTASNFFDFSLNRPNDYLFQYNFLGRSEETGLYSQQFIMAEGGFKTSIPQPYANDFILATNLSIGVWKYLEVYGDWAMIKRENQAAKGYFDTGLRLNILPDYLELYFPVYSSLGWSFDAGNYDEKLRFVITVDPKALTGLFSRKWF